MTSRTLASVLLEYKESEGLTQGQLADLLQVSQPYISQILTGKKIPSKNIDLLLRICRLAKVDPSELGISLSVLSNSDAELIYEESLLALGAGDLVGAEIGLTTICSAAGSWADSGLTVGDGLAARAEFRLANIRRDWNFIDGPRGAKKLYLDALAKFVRDNATAYVVETNLFLGVCNEMSQVWDDALGFYNMISEYSPANSLPVARARNRRGAIFTKRGKYDLARSELGHALKIVRNSDAQATYAFVLEKIAILDAHTDEYDNALKGIYDARTMLAPGEVLRRLQNRVVEADILYRQGSHDDCQKLLADLLSEAKSNHFGHQEKWIRNFSKQIATRS